MKRLVRVHFVDDTPSLEGILLRFRTGLSAHYIVEQAAVVSPGAAQPVQLTGNRVRVPRERVAFIQELR